MNTGLIVVSNRLPLTLRKGDDGHWTTERSSGGLASAMNPILRRGGAKWIGWAGTGGEDNQEQRSILQDWAQKEHYFAVDLPPDIATGFYEGYSNQTLWPVFHNFPSQLKFDAKGWEAYLEANRI